MIEVTGNHRPTKELLSLQVLRGIAAMLVVIYHAGRSVTVEWPSTFPHLLVRLPQQIIESGAVGVDIFFVISGFIMVYVSPPYRDGCKPASDFLIRRVIRIYPMYAFATLAIIMLSVYQIYRHGIEFPYTPARIGAAFVFVPTFDDDPRRLVPILGQGWTLFYEMFFYVCFATVLALLRRCLFLPLVAIFCTTLGIAHLSGSAGPLAAFFSDTIILEFLFGCAVGLAAQRKMITPRFAFTWLVLSIVFFVCGLIFVPDQSRFIFWGIPGALFLLSFLKFEMTSVRWPAALLLLGDASYSIYLTHYVFIHQLRDFTIKHSPIVLPGDLFLTVLSTIAVGLGVGIYLILEKPLNSWLVGLYLKGSSRGTVAVG